MTRTKDEKAESKTKHEFEDIGRILDHRLLVFRPGNDKNVYQVNLKSSVYETLVMLKMVDADGNKFIGFVGAGSLVSALRKAERGWLDDTIKWKPDQFAE